MSEQRALDTRMGTIKYFVSGQGEEYVIMLQGWATLHSLYDPIVDLLAKKYTVIFPALPGFGESAEPSEAMSVSDYAEMIRELLESLGIKKAHFFCHSFGGRVFFKLCALESCPIEPISATLADVAGIMPKKKLLRKSSAYAHTSSADACLKHGYAASSSRMPSRRCARETDLPITIRQHL